LPERNTRVFLAPFSPKAPTLERYRRSMMLHHCGTDGAGYAPGAAAREARKSETMAFCAAVKRPYQRIDTGMSPLSRVPL
jgi:hypothetical protein